MKRLAIAYAAVLFAVILIADSGRMKAVGDFIHGVFLLDKGLHFAMYGVLALLANLALARQGERSLARAIVVGSILVITVATIDEFSNRLIPVRSWSLGDLAANYLGVLCVGVLPLVAFAPGPDRSEGDGLAGRQGLDRSADDSIDPQSTASR